MKKIFILILSLAFTKAQSQSTLEKKVIDELNSYRTKLSGTNWKPKNASTQAESDIGKLAPLIFDKDLSDISRHHATYIRKCLIEHPNVRKFFQHEETEIDLANFQEMNFDQRSELLHKRFASKFMLNEIQIQSLTFKKGTSENRIAQAIIATFDKSDPHKESMIIEFSESSETPLVGISVLESRSESPENVQYTIVINIGVKTK